MATIESPGPITVSRAAAALANDVIVAIPTETVYGLAANAYSEVAVQKIFTIKGRPSHNPLITHIASLDHLELVTTKEAIAHVQHQLDRLLRFMPGPLSIVLPKNDRIAPSVSAGLDTVAIRIPSHPTTLDILSRCSFPLAAPSANPSNYISPTSAQHVMDQLGNQIDLIVDGGDCLVGIESTILDLTSEIPRILRHGFITAEQISEALSIPIDDLLTQPVSHEITAPGMLREHYAPSTPVKMISHHTDILAAPKNTGLIYISASNPPTGTECTRHSRPLSRDGDSTEISHNLFKTLREFDRLGLDLILIEECNASGVGRAIMDRLTRASARWDNK